MQLTQVFAGFHFLQIVSRVKVFNTSNTSAAHAVDDSICIIFSSGQRSKDTDTHQIIHWTNGFGAQQLTARPHRGWQRRWGVLNTLTQVWTGFRRWTRPPYIAGWASCRYLRAGGSAQGGFYFCLCQWDGWGGKRGKSKSLFRPGDILDRFRHVDTKSAPPHRRSRRCIEHMASSNTLTHAKEISLPLMMMGKLDSSHALIWERKVLTYTHMHPQTYTCARQRSELCTKEWRDDATLCLWQAEWWIWWINQFNQDISHCKQTGGDGWGGVAGEEGGVELEALYYHV